MDPVIQLFIIGFALAGCAFFSAMEISFLSTNRLKIELERNKGTLGGRLTGLFYANESLFISVLLLGNTISYVLFGGFSALLLDTQMRGIGLTAPFGILFIEIVIVSIVALGFAEFIPKALVQTNPYRFMRLASPLMFLVYILLYLPNLFITAISAVFLRLIGAERRGTDKVFSRVDLEEYVEDLSSRIHEEEVIHEMQILRRALDFSNVKARDCMVPRMDIVAVNVEDDIDTLRQLFIEKGLSKILIYRESVDKIIGYVHSHEMFKRPATIKQILLPISYVPEAIGGNELLQLFSKQSGNMAVVVDEYGGTAGIVTLEDVIEEIFGEIEDEHDIEDLLEERLGDNEFRFSARVDIDYLNQEYDFDLPESDEYDTLGGFIIHLTETIPEQGTVVEYEHLSLVVEDVSDRRIETVRIKVH